MPQSRGDSVSWENDRNFYTEEHANTTTQRRGTLEYTRKIRDDKQSQALSEYSQDTERSPLYLYIAKEVKAPTVSFFLATKVPP